MRQTIAKVGLSLSVINKGGEVSLVPQVHALLKAAAYYAADEPARVAPWTLDDLAGAALGMLGVAPQVPAMLALFGVGDSPSDAWRTRGLQQPDPELIYSMRPSSTASMAGFASGSIFTYHWSVR